MSSSVLLLVQRPWWWLCILLMSLLIPILFLVIMVCIMWNLALASRVVNISSALFLDSDRTASVTIFSRKRNKNKTRILDDGFSLMNDPSTSFSHQQLLPGVSYVVSDSI